MKNLLLLLLIPFYAFLTYAQEEDDLSVPANVLAELKLKEVNYHGKIYKYKVKYPVKYSKHKTYKVYLALAGGSQSVEEADYCYYAWFRSSYFDKYITIIPISSDGSPLKSYNEEEILSFYDMLLDNEKITKSDWILGGTSNGGAAAFNFLMAYSGFFEGIIVMPGMIHNRKKIPEVWKTLKIVLAYGEKDEAWMHLAKEAFNHLNKTIKNVVLYKMKGQGHLVTPDYDIDNVYKQYFDK